MIKTCPICGAKFEPVNPRRKYCSERCRRIFVNHFYTIKSRSAKRDDTNTCQNCGKSFKPAFSDERFCSDLCRLDFFGFKQNLPVYVSSSDNWKLSWSAGGVADDC